MQPENIKLTERQVYTLWSLLTNLLDVNTDTTVRRDARNILKKLEGVSLVKAEKPHA